MNNKEITAEILISQCGAGYVADLDHPCRVGSSPVGTGETEIEALAALFIRLPESEFSLIRKSKFLKINGILWREISK
jgi:hypothetical protein